MSQTLRVLLLMLATSALGLGGASPALGQSPTTQRAAGDDRESKGSSKAAADPAARARQLLDQLAAKQKDVQTMRAGFVQEVTTPLTRKPIISKGTLVFRREPACAQFTINEPRRSVVRFDEKTYQVYRPDKKQAERFLLDDGDLAGAFVQILSPSTSELEKSFAVTSRPPTQPGGPVTIELDATVERLQKYFSKLRLVVDEESAELRAIQYRNRDGDEVKISLHDVEFNAEIDPKSFASELPPGTELRVHSIEKE